MSRYTPDGDKAIEMAHSIAVHDHIQTAMRPAHLLYGILCDSQSRAVRRLKKLDVDLNRLMSRAAVLASAPTPEARLQELGESTQQAQDALTAARQMARGQANSADLLLGLMKLENCATAQLLAEFGVTPEKFAERGAYV